jgi:hypothetical protein
MDIEAGFPGPVNEPDPVPIHWLKVNPVPAVAATETLLAKSYHPASPGMVGGVAANALPAPDGELDRVSWY